MANAKFLSLNAMDLLKGAIVAAGTGAGVILYPVLQSGKVPSKGDLMIAGGSAIAAGVSYLLKNLFTNSRDELAKPEPK
jgi:hypothetical protein